nr:acetyl-CoA carboxylase subunit [Syringa emodi]
MERWWFNSMVFKKELKRGYGINNSMNNLGPIENTSKSEDPNRKAKNIHSWRGRDNHSWRGRDNSSYSNVDHLFGIKDIISDDTFLDDTFLVRDSNGDSYSIYFDSENQIFEIDNDHSFLSELESPFYNTQYSWNNHINSCIYSYLQSQIYMDTSIVSMDTSIVSMDTSIVSMDIVSMDTSVVSDDDSSEFTYRKDIEGPEKYKHLWRLCDNCEQLNYNKSLKARHDICEYCGYHLKMSSSYRIKLSIDPGTWHPMDEDMVSPDPDPIGWDDSEEEPDQDRIEEEPYLLIPGTSHPIDEDMVSLDPPIGWDDSEEEPDQDRIEEEPDQDRIEEEPYRIEEEPYLLIPGTSHPIDEDMVSLDPPIGWDDSEEEPDQDRIEEEPYRIEEEPDQDRIEEEPYRIEEEPDQDRIEEEPDQDRIEEEEESYEEGESYKDRIDSYRRETGKTEAVQTGIGLLNERPVAIGVMDFEFMGGSMGSVVGEKITRLIEYATKKRIPLIIVCASGGARMQEGSLSLMQMAKISSALYDYQSNKKLFYVSILTSPTTGGVTASFGMLGDIIIAEPNAYIAFAGKRVIEQLLNIEVPEGVQETENLFEKGSFDLIVPRNSLKSVLTELFKLHGVPTMKEIFSRTFPENSIK